MLPDGPLGTMMKFWNSLRPPSEITIFYCNFFSYFTWLEYQLTKGYKWPPLDSDGTSVCQYLCLYLINTGKGIIKQGCGQMWLKGAMVADEITKTVGLYIAKEGGEMKRNKERPPSPVQPPPNPLEQVEGPTGGSSLYPSIPDPERLDLNSQVSPKAPPDYDSKGENDLEIIFPYKTSRGTQYVL